MDFKGIAKEIVSTLLIVGLIVGIGIAITGTWPFMVAVQSGSMEPHIHKGDVIILFGLSRTKIVTWREGVKIHYEMFGDYGDVIVYHPNGDNSRTPIIHRVIAYVHKGDRIPMLLRENGKTILVYTKYVAKSNGYITQGDANPIPDQLAPEWNIQPVKREWIVGVAKFRIPYVGWLRLII